MPIIAKDSGGADFEPVPAGTHRAVCTMVVDMGVQPSNKFKPKPKVYVRWELPDELIEWTDKNGKQHKGPMVIGKHYTLSLSEKANLRADLESWRGKMFTETELEGFDLKNILGKACQVGVTHKKPEGSKRVYANVSAVLGSAKGAPTPTASGELIYYSLDEHDDEVFEKLPEWLQNAINGRVPEKDEPPSETVGVKDDFDDEIPF